MSLFGKRDEAAAEAPALGGDFELTLEFEPQYLIFTAGPLRLRLRREDLRRLADPAWLDQGFNEAGNVTTRRVCDEVAIEKMARIWRYLKHGLTLDKISKLMGEGETEIRQFYGWAVASKEGGGGLGEMARQKEIQQDILPLRNPVRGEAGPIREVQVFADKIDRAYQIGVDHAALKKWIEDNKAVLDALK
jgi:hypothetical protein